MIIYEFKGIEVAINKFKGLIRRIKGVTLPKLDFDFYQEEAHKTAIYNDKQNKWYVYPLLGLTGEVGELNQLFKKVIRDVNGEITEEKVKEIKSEVGDILWYLSEFCTAFGCTLNEVARLNLEKLKARQANDQLRGSGDWR